MVWPRSFRLFMGLLAIACVFPCFVCADNSTLAVDDTSNGTTTVNTTSSIVTIAAPTTNASSTNTTTSPHTTLNTTTSPPTTSNTTTSPSTTSRNTTTSTTANTTSTLTTVPSTRTGTSSTTSTTPSSTTWPTTTRKPTTKKPVGGGLKRDAIIGIVAGGVLLVLLLSSSGIGFWCRHAKAADKREMEERGQRRLDAIEAYQKRMAEVKDSKPNLDQQNPEEKPEPLDPKKFKHRGPLRIVLGSPLPLENEPEEESSIPAEDKPIVWAEEENQVWDIGSEVEEVYTRDGKKLPPVRRPKPKKRNNSEKGLQVIRE